jgi:glycosyl transferase family 2
MPSNPAAPEITVFHGYREGGEPVGSICLPVRDAVKAPTVTSLLMSDWAWIPKGKTVDYNLVQGGILTLQRNEAVQRMRGDWLLFIDDDMVFAPDAIGRLVAARDEIDADVIGGLCFRRTPPYQPTLYMRENPTHGAYNFLERWDSDIVEVDATGMAFALIHKRVFEKIAGTSMPSEAVRGQLGPPNFFRWDGRLGEDLRFCQDAKAAGCRIWVDTRIEIGHIGEIEIRHKQFLTELALRDDELVKVRRDVNDQMGLPTVTPDEARKELGW